MCNLYLLCLSLLHSAKLRRQIGQDGVATLNYDKNTSFRKEINLKKTNVLNAKQCAKNEFA